MYKAQAYIYKQIYRIWYDHKISLGEAQLGNKYVVSLNVGVREEMKKDWETLL